MEGNTLSPSEWHEWLFIYVALPNNTPLILLRLLTDLSPHSAAYMRQRIGLALFQIMASRLFGAKPLSKAMFGYCQLDHKEQTSVKCQSKFQLFNSIKCIWKCRLPKWRPYRKHWPRYNGTALYYNPKRKQCVSAFNREDYVWVVVRDARHFGLQTTKMIKLHSSTLT